MIAIDPIYTAFYDLDGEPLENGYVYIGEPNQNPETEPVSIYWDLAATQPAAQPLRTLSGFLHRTGTPANIFVDGDYSITVRDQSRSLVSTTPSAAAAGDLGPLLASSGGSAIIGFIQAGSGAVLRTLQSKVRDFVSVKDFGAVGDGVADDSAAITLAIATGRRLFWGDTDDVYRIVTELVFDQDGQHNYGSAALLFDGAISGRLFRVTADYVSFDGLVFDGNEKQVYGGLIYLDTDGAYPKFDRCTIKDVMGVHSAGGTSTPANNQSGVLISPYGVVGFAFNNCIFQNITNDNAGAGGVTPTSGYGFANGAAFFKQDFSEPTTIQTNPTSGVFKDCTFKNILTILANGLSEGDQVSLMDADGIRFYGNNTGETKLPVVVEGCEFINCGKRAVKVSIASGVQIRGITVISTTALQYPMVTPVKADGGQCIVDGVNVYCPSTAPVRIVVQTHDAPDVKLNNIYANYAEEFWEITPTSTAIALRGYRANNLVCPVLSESGILTTVSPATITDFEFSNLTLKIKSGVNNGNLIAIQTVTGAELADVTLRDSQLIGGDVKIGGFGWTVENVYHEIDNASYTGFSASRSILELGPVPGIDSSKYSNVRGYTLNIKALPNGYFSVSRTQLFLIYGDDIRVRGFELTVPDTLTTAYAHGAFSGNDMNVDGLIYSGKSDITWMHIGKATYGPYLRSTLTNATRLGGVAADLEFLFLGNGERCVVSDVNDLRNAAAGSVNVDDGTAAAGDTDAWIINGVFSATSSVGNPTFGAAIALALVSNEVKF